MKKLLVELLIAGASSLAVSQAHGDPPNLWRDMNGMILGDDVKPTRPLYVGVGDTVARLMANNPYLKQLKLSGEKELRLPLLTELDVRYDDGDVRLDVGCASTINIDGNGRFSGAANIGIELCDRPLNDWKPALHAAAQIMHRLEQQNAHVQNLGEFYTHATDEELRKIGGNSLPYFRNNVYALRTVEEADAKFAQEAEKGNSEVLSGRQRNTYARVGIYAGTKMLFTIGVSKVADFGGDNLTEEQRRTMRYEVTMSFRLRNDVDPIAVKR